MKEAFRKALRVFSRGKADYFRFFGLEASLRLMCLAPLIFLFVDELRPLAIISPLMIVLILLPARQNSALCMNDAIHGENLFSMKTVSMEGYFKKLRKALSTTLMAFFWGIPLFGLIFLIIWVYFSQAVAGVTDAFSALRTLANLGGGDIVTGAKYGVLIMFACLMLETAGCFFLSGRRFSADEKRAKKRHYHLKLVAANICSATLYIPFMIAAGIIIAVYFSDLSAAFSMILSGNGIASVTAGLWWIAASFMLLVLPLIPLRHLVIAAFVSDMEDKDAS